MRRTGSPASPSSGSTPAAAPAPKPSSRCSRSTPSHSCARRCGSAGAATPTPRPQPTPAAPDVLIALDLRELLLHGLLTASGWVVIAARGRRAVAGRPGGWGLRRFLPSTAGRLGRAAPRHADPRPRDRRADRARGADLPPALGGVVGDQALRVHADRARRRAVPELRPADPRRPHHPALAHPEADHLGGPADAAARPRHRHRGHRRVGVGEAQAAGGAGQPRARADRAGVAARRARPRRAPGRRRRGARSRRARLARRRSAHLPPAGAQPARRSPRSSAPPATARCTAGRSSSACSSPRRWSLQAWVAARFTAFAWSSDTLCFRSATATRHVDAGARRPHPGGRPRALPLRPPLGHGRRPRRHRRRRERRPSRPHPLARRADIARALYARLRHAARRSARARANANSDSQLPRAELATP